MLNLEEIVQQLDLQPHPEGGYFKETYRSSGSISSNDLGDQYEGQRNYSTCIYFLLTAENFSAFHRIKQDEIWHFYDGSPIQLHMIDPEGNYSKQLIGRDLRNGELPQFVVPGGYWFASEVSEGGSFSFTGCTVAPGFSFEDFDLPSRKELTKMFPQHREVINRMTHA